MKIKSVFCEEFKKYGKVLKGYDVEKLLQTLDSTSEKPMDSTIYVASDPGLEKLDVAKEFSTNAYGGQEIQIGYCNGNNTKLNCLEYHRGSELNIPSSDMILLVASIQDVCKGHIKSSKVKAFRAPKGTVVQVFETTLHYAPCTNVVNGKTVEEGFRVIIVLPKGTNTDKPEMKVVDEEDKLLWARNKWLIAHPSTSEAKAGAFAGIDGPNIDLLVK